MQLTLAVGDGASLPYSIYNASTYNSAIVAANIGSLHCHNYIVAMQHVDTYVELWHCIVRSENLVRPKC